MAISKKIYSDELKSNDQRKVAIALSDLLIEQVSDAWVKENLTKIRDIVWENEPSIPKTDGSYEADAKRNEQNQARIRAILEGSGGNAPSAESKKILAEAYARLGHMYEIAGHVARENFFCEREEKLQKFLQETPNKQPDESILTPGGVHELLYTNERFKGFTNAYQAADALSKPVSEYIFTQHPTNTNTLDAMKLQRKIESRIEKLIRSDEGDKTKQLNKLQKTLKEFAEKPIVQTKNFTAFDETNIVINFLSNIYKDIDRLYETVERGLSRRFKGGYTEDAKKHLDLKVRFGSWGSAGDKDGNKNIRSENTLEAIVLHKRQALKLLVESLEEIKDLPETLGKRKEQFKEAIQKYDAVIKQIEDIRSQSTDGNDIPLNNAQFNDAVDKAKSISRELDKNAFKNDLLKAVDKADGVQKDSLRAIERKFRVFGFNLGKIEYRETAEEYSRVVSYLFSQVKEGNGLKKSAKQYVETYNIYVAELAKAESNQDKHLIASAAKDLEDQLNRVLSDEVLKAEFINTTSNFIRNANPTILRKLDSDDAAITYHTLRRMELARDFDDMITHNVLAECKGVNNLMEALALQVAVTKNNERALMNIVPLFEEAETMERIPAILKEGLENKVYHDHVKAIQKRDQKINVSEGIKDKVSLTQQIQIAHSDNARRAGAIGSRGIIHEGHAEASNAILEYNKEHPNEPVNLQFFEGGSLSDSYRNGVRAATAMIKDFGLGDFSKMTFQGGDLLNYFNQATSMERVTLRSIVQQVELQTAGSKPAKISKHEEAVHDGLKELQTQYDALIYEAPGNPIGKLLYALGYHDHIAAGNAGTRGGKRGGDNEQEKINGIDASKLRTIGFSETLQHEKLHPTFMGAGEIRKTVQTALGTGQLNAQQWNQLYQDSPSFRDAIDKLAYSIINSDLKAAGEKLSRKMTKNIIPRDVELLKFTNNTLPNQYIEAGKLVYSAITGKEFSEKDNTQGKIILMQHRINQMEDNILDAADRMKHLIKKLPEMQHFESHYQKHNYIEGLDVVKETATSAVSNAKEYFARLFHNAVDTFTHGRNFKADDPKYKAAYMEQATQNEKQIALGT